MASFIENLLGGAAEGLNEQYDIKRKEERANRMLTKELELKRDFGIDSERRLEEKEAKKNISKLGIYFTPAEVDSIVGQGTEYVNYALANGKIIKDNGGSAGSILNKSFASDVSGSSSMSEKDPQYTDFVENHINDLKNPPKLNEVKNNQPFFLSPKPTLDLGDMGDTYEAASLNISIKISTTDPSNANYSTLLETEKRINKGLLKWRNDNPAEADTSPINQDSHFKTTMRRVMQLANFKDEFDEGANSFKYMFEGQEGKYLTHTIGGLKEVISNGKTMGYKDNVLSGETSLKNTYKNLRENQAVQFNRRIQSDGTIKKGKAGENFQFIEEVIDTETGNKIPANEMFSRKIANGQITEGATFAFVSPDNPAFITIGTYSKYFNPSETFITRNIKQGGIKLGD